jgi:hypothetical protein
MGKQRDAAHNLAWERVLASDELKTARAKLSMHEMRQIIRIVDRAFVDGADSVPYDPQGPEVTMLHHWFADNRSPGNWGDDGCRSENARDLLNAFSKAGFILVEIPEVHK